MKFIFKVLVYIVFLTFFNVDFLIKADIILLNNFNQDSSIQAKTNSPQNKKLDYDSVRVLYEEGLNLHNSGKFLSSETVFLKTVTIAKKYGDKELIALSYHYLGRIESWKSKISSSIQYHKQALTLFTELNNLEFIAKSNNNIANGYEIIGEFENALKYYRRNIKNRKDIKFIYPIVTSYQDIANLYAKLHNYKQTYSLLQEGLEYAEEKGNKRSLAELYFAAGKLFFYQNINKDIALEYLAEAKKIFAELNNLNYINWINLCIADIYNEMGQNSVALEYIKYVTETTYKTNYSMHSLANYMLGMIFKKQNQYDSTLIYFNKSIELMCKECPEILIHKTLIEAANTHLLLGNYKKSFTSLDRAKNIAVNANSGIKIVKSYEELANYYKVIKKTDTAKYYLLKAHKLAKELGLIKRIKNTAISLSKLFIERKEFQSSSEYLAIAAQMSDSLASIEKYKEISKLEMRFELEKKDEERKLEAELLQSEIDKQKLIRNSVIAITILIIIIGFILYKAYRDKRKDYKLLEEQKKEIQEISKKLHNEDKRKLDFFTNISHEIRTPLTLIISPLQRLLKINENKQATKQLKLALNNTKKLKALVNQILDLQKIDEDHLNLNISRFEIVSFCKDITSSFEGYSYQHNCKLQFNSNTAYAVVELDNMRISAIISNLLSNAFKFNKNGGEVKFNLIVTASQIKITINDTGKGIPPEDLTKMGSRYYQVPSSFSVEGTGLGFAYVKELIYLMKGTLEVSSEVNIGTKVEIIIPCEGIIIEDNNPEKLEIIPRDNTLTNLKDQISDESDKELTKSILIVEDNNDLRLYLHDLFNPFYKVLTAKNGEEGKDMALKYLPDLILSDIMMPNIQGNELCKMLKNDVNTCHITIILLTAKNSFESKFNGYDCGADDYIEKPFDSDLLLKKVKNVLATIENTRKQFNIMDYENKTTSMYTDLDKEFLKNIITIIHENLNNSDFTVEILADNIGMHRRTLLRKFKALTGKSPAEIIKHTKMSEAAKLIKDNKLRVNEVAFMVGYEDTNRFSKAFKQFHGVPPSSYN